LFYFAKYNIFFFIWEDIFQSTKHHIRKGIHTLPPIVNENIVFAYNISDGRTTIDIQANIDANRTCVDLIMKKINMVVFMGIHF
jgi:hypothetical protein